MSTASQDDWLPETQELFLKLEAEKGWTQMKRTDADHQTLDHTFTRIRTAKGQAFHFAIFLYEGERKLRGLCQFSDETNGLLRGWVHAGAIATMHDSTTAVLATNMGTKLAFTAYIHINFMRPIPVRSPILMEAKIEKMEGKKMFLTSSLKSLDETTVYSDCRALWIDAASSKL
ncbi:acyl-coenzyme A thioesterase THEM4-like isoform X2 [Patiria miniata]|nr:acyl-coenzyme A thioesterase THEM4-like isoform X2 [Patiria miniata]XP_038078632.1 acyl-coenzyme A thioesterase THEM4-like isoform X2 [Patiria miniata]XP_038078633.1 acyl-coenzyme A thioesterase THEM4-like isoform X2 [Patiria miniata]XP_038078634.1 acyl-coenzyme A thioesterase THEM4-like isoform X2 [Patiria miniata]XP_038078635.1 acyl-coenzyme A thioesterase THEM4-like isoform X2 [Patiria miniata]XP_038078636.1 acyl-coenzyme A thioesterase THEM4-like isoform X2 [Patiria miniata]